MKSFQQMFVETRGGPVQVGQQQVVQRDRIPIESGKVTVRFLGQPAVNNGVILKSHSGGITLSDGSVARSVIVWDDPRLPRSVTHHVECRDGKLSIWNVYRTRHPTGEVTEDYFTGNAGMIVACSGTRSRRYNCSSGPGPFDPQQFTFELHW